MKTEDLFNKFLVEIANQVSQNAYTIWFSKLEIVSITNNLITIKVPMEIHKKMLGETYNTLKIPFLLSQALIMILNFV